MQVLTDDMLIHVAGGSSRGNGNLEDGDNYTDYGRTIPNSRFSDALDGGNSGQGGSSPDSCRRDDPKDATSGLGAMGATIAGVIGALSSGSVVGLLGLGSAAMGFAPSLGNGNCGPAVPSGAGGNPMGDTSGSGMVGN